jgi:hypothetical protein
VKIDVHKLRKTAEVVATRNRSLKRGHPKYMANVTSAEELVLTDGVIALLEWIRELESRYEGEHADDCMIEIGKRAGYWNCDCKEAA